MISIVKTIIRALNRLVYSIHNLILIKRKKIVYKMYPKITGKIFIYGEGKISFGENVRINSSLPSNPIGGDAKMVISISTGASLEVGNHVGISNSTIVCTNHIKIGNYVKIGGNTKIYDTDFHSVEFENRRDYQKDVAVQKPVIIYDDAFIGAHSIILKGVTIGKGSIVGAGSVVTKSIPPGEIWGGNPAKFIKKI